MKKSEHAQKSKDLLLSILKYCEKNNFKIWYGQSSTVFTKYRIGSKSDFEGTKISELKYSRSISELTEDQIRNGEYYFIFYPQNMDKNFSIQANSNAFPHIEKINNQLLVYIFLNHDIEIAKNFINEWINSPIKLGQLFEYTNEQYPNGFIKTSLKNNEKVWEEFIDVIPTDRFIESFEIEEELSEIKEFRNQLKKLILDLNNKQIITLFDKIISKFTENDMSDDLKLQISYFLFDVLPKEILDKYNEKFPFINNLIQPKTKNTLFSQNYEEVLEKAIFSKIDIYEYFKNSELKASEYNDIVSNTLQLISQNPSLNERALIVSCEHNDEFLLFMSLMDNSLINKNSMKSLVINILENFFNSRELASGSLSSTDVMDKILPKLVNTSIERWLLTEELNDNKIETLKTKRKI